MPNGHAAAVKIACRNVWKLYGPRPGQFFVDGSGAVDDVDATLARVLAAGHIPAAVNVSFDVRVGEIFVIMGLSGSGKSTMVRCLSRLIEPSAGEVLFDGSDLLRASEAELIAIRRHKMGMVFQGFGLLPHLTVLDNVAFPLKIQGVALSARRQRAAEMVALVGLEGREDAFPRELSGGQRQRVGIARSLAVEPQLWLLDEPFSALDPLIRRQMQDEFVRLQTLLAKTIVFITHDFLEALKLADRIAIMKDGQVVQIGTPSEIVLQPATDYVAEFTEDVPLARVVTAADVMESAQGATDAGRSVPLDTTLETLLPNFAESSQAIPVADATGQIVGVVQPGAVLRALAGAAARGPGR